MSDGLSGDDQLSMGLKVDGVAAIFASITTALTTLASGYGLSLNPAIAGVIGTSCGGLIYLFFLKKRGKESKLAEEGNLDLRNRMEEDFRIRLADENPNKIKPMWMKIKTEIVESKLSERNQKILTSRLEEEIQTEKPELVNLLLKVIEESGGAKNDSENLSIPIQPELRAIAHKMWSEVLNRPSKKISSIGLLSGENLLSKMVYWNARVKDGSKTNTGKSMIANWKGKSTIIDKFLRNKMEQKNTTEMFFIILIIQNLSRNNTASPYNIEWNDLKKIGRKVLPVFDLPQDFSFYFNTEKRKDLYLHQKYVRTLELPKDMNNLQLTFDNLLDKRIDLNKISKGITEIVDIASARIRMSLTEEDSSGVVVDSKDRIVVRGDLIHASGSNINTGSGNQTIIGTQTVMEGIPAEQHSELLTKFQLMELELEKSQEKIKDFETVDEQTQRKNAANSALEIANQLQSTGVEIDAEKALLLGSAAELSGMTEIAEGYFKQGLKLYKIADDEPGEARALNHLGNLDRMRGDIDSAKNNYHTALGIFESLRDMTGISHSLHLLGNCEWKKGNLDECSKLYMRSLEIRREHCSDEEIGKTLLNLGSLYVSKKDLPVAEEYYKEGLEFFKKESNHYHIGAALNNLGHVSYEQGENIIARMHYNEALRMFEEIGSKSGIAKSLNNLGSIEFQNGEYKAAEEYYLRSLKIRRTLGDLAGEALVRFNIGEIKLHLEEIDASLSYYKDALKLYIELGIPIPEWFADNGFNDLDSEWDFPPKGHTEQE